MQNGAHPSGERRSAVELLDDLGDPTGADGTATLADREPQTLVHGDGLDQLHRDLGVVTGHHHLGALRQRHHTGHVGGAEVELRAVVVEERRVPAARCTPRSNSPPLSPACPWSSSLRNISTPVTVVLVLVGLIPTISTSSL